MSSRSMHSRRMVPTNRSQTAFARGALMGVLMMRIPSAAKTASKEEVNFVSRSRMRNLADVVRCVRSEQRLRACWVTQPGDGVGCYPGQVDEAGVVLDEEQHVEPSEQDGVDREEVTGDQALRLST